MMTRDGKIKICDLGTCKYLRENNDITRTYCGSPAYMAPEMLSYQEYSYEHDFWSISMILLEMTLGVNPVAVLTENNNILEVINNLDYVISSCVEDYSEELIDFMKKSLNKDKDIRKLFYEHIYSHPWYDENYDDCEFSKLNEICEMRYNHEKDFIMNEEISPSKYIKDKCNKISEMILQIKFMEDKSLDISMDLSKYIGGTPTKRR
jgi:serine/threonine protein kinase